VGLFTVIPIAVTLALATSASVRARVAAYAFLLTTDRYPPFSIGP